MSWDLFVQDWGNFESLDDISNDFEPQSIGKRSEVIDNIKAAEPTIDFSNPSWGILENEQFTIEFNMGNSEECDGFVMHIRGNELALPGVGNILDRLKLRAADGSSPFFIDIEKTKGDLQKWIDYRDSILNR